MSNEAKNGPDPQQHSEPTEELMTKQGHSINGPFHFRRCPRLISPVSASFFRPSVRRDLSTTHLFAELDPFWRSLGWSQGIGAVARHHFSVARHRETRVQVRLRRYDDERVAGMGVAGSAWVMGTGR